ncbi:MAG: DUF3892 domain-containing protein [Kineosporiaceae bacterium]|nr:DUF3892 domain-containing protein [Aeromicrobium sp.]
MSIRITAVHLVGGVTHQHIEEVKWDTVETSGSGQSSRASIVTWLDTSTTNVAWVGAGANAVRVHVVRPAVGEPYIQTVADGQWANNLLSLARY